MCRDRSWTRASSPATPQNSHAGSLAYLADDPERLVGGAESRFELGLILRGYGGEQTAAGLGIEEECAECGRDVRLQVKQPFIEEKVAIAVQPTGYHVVLGVGERAVQERNGFRIKFEPYSAVPRHLHGMAEQAVTGHIGASVDGELLE